MSDDTTLEANQQNGSNGGGDQPNLGNLQSRIAELEAQLTEANNEAAKHKKLRRDAENERNSLRTTRKVEDDQTENYKQRWADEQDLSNKRLDRLKTTQIQVALQSALPAAGLPAEVLADAMRLVDVSLIEWDEEGGVDRQSVTAAVQSFKKGIGKLLFGQAVTERAAKPAANGSGDEKTITLAEYTNLIRTNPEAWHAKRKAGFKIAD